MIAFISFCRSENDCLFTFGEGTDELFFEFSCSFDALFTFTLNHTDNVQKYFDTLLDEVEKYKYELRLALQITTSPVFGKRMRDKSKDFRLLYETYANKLISIFNCTYLQAETFIYSIIAYVIDYAIWDDRDKTQMLLDNLRTRINSNLGI